ncbi:MAG: hypothetical protein ACFFBD_29820, partial [Candidatus Hodarchaeota archaeon]
CQLSGVVGFLNFTKDLTTLRNNQSIIIVPNKAKSSFLKILDKKEIASEDKEILIFPNLPVIDDSFS